MEILSLDQSTDLYSVTLPSEILIYSKHDEPEPDGGLEFSLNRHQVHSKLLI